MITEARIAMSAEPTPLSGTGDVASQGVSLIAGDVVLVYARQDGTTNGPYVVASGAWTRHTDHDTGAEFVRPWEIFIREGIFANYRFHYVGPDSPTLNTSVLNFDYYARGTAEDPGLGMVWEESTNSIGLQPRGISGSHAIGPLSLGVTAGGVLESIDRGYGGDVYIDGLIPSFTSTTIVTATDGAAFVTAASANAEIIGAPPVSASGLSANSLYYLYAYAGPSNVVGLVLSATAPAAPYLGTARAMSGDSTRRYLGAIRSSGTGAAYNFLADQQGGKRLLVTYLEDTTLSPFRVVSGGTATTNQTVNLGPSGLKLVPASCRMVLARVGVNATTGVWIDNSEMSTSPAGGTGETTVTTLERAQHVWISLDGSQSFRWANNVAGGATNIDIRKYIDRR